MIKLDFSNVEELIFLNEKARAVLPPFFANYFESWLLGKRVPALKQVGRQAMYDLLNSLEEDHVFKLEELLGERITVEKLNYSVVKNLQIPLDQAEICKQLCNVSGDNYYSVWRDDQYLYISLWR